MSNPLLVGVDVDRKRNAVCVMDGQGQELVSRFTMDSNRPGTEAFVRQMAELVLEGDFDVIQVAAEATVMSL